jgi:hypothetical protein
VRILAAQEPDQPAAPVTVWTRDFVTIQWTEPVTNGAAILSYDIQVREADETTFSNVLSHCDGSLASVVNALSCTIPVSILRAAPFSLPWGTNVHAQLYATNSEGDSVMSEVGNGAIITTYPDAPINLQENSSDRDTGILGMVWEQAAFNGGAVIEDYQIWIAVSGQAFEVLASGLASPAYIAASLTPGITYDFKVQARNSYDYSAYSATLTLLCAWKPFKPDAPTTYRVTDQMYFDWTEPFTNGSPITGYRIFIQQDDLATYTEETIECIGTDADVIAGTICHVSLARLIVSPWSLTMNDEVWAKIIAINTYGESEISEQGNNGLVKLVPDAPVNLQNVEFNVDDRSST